MRANVGNQFRTFGLQSKLKLSNNISAAKKLRFFILKKSGMHTN